MKTITESQLWYYLQDRLTQAQQDHINQEVNKVPAAKSMDVLLREKRKAINQNLARDGVTLAQVESLFAKARTQDGDLYSLSAEDLKAPAVQKLLQQPSMSQAASFLQHAIDFAGKESGDMSSSKFRAMNRTEQRRFLAEYSRNQPIAVQQQFVEKIIFPELYKSKLTADQRDAYGEALMLLSAEAVGGAVEAAPRDARRAIAKLTQHRRSNFFQFVVARAFPTMKEKDIAVACGIVADATVDDRVAILRAFIASGNAVLDRGGWGAWLVDSGKDEDFPRVLGELQPQERQMLLDSMKRSKASRDSAYCISAAVRAGNYAVGDSDFVHQLEKARWNEGEEPK